MVEAAGNDEEAEEVLNLSGCFQKIEDCDDDENPPPAGTIITIYEAPRNPDGTPNHEKAQATHSFVSRGGGNYKSKDGAAEPKDDAPFDEAAEGYLDPKEGAARYYVCYINTCDNQ